MSRAITCLGSLFASFALLAAAAQGAGAPFPYDTSPDASLVAPNGEGPSYATVAGAGQTTVLQIDGGEILRRDTIDGLYGIPVVASDGSPAGISGDGSRLVLSEFRSFRFPRERSNFIVVDIRSDGRMRPQPPLTLRGDFSFDALSADGEMMYLTEYTSRDLNNYAVREYDVGRQDCCPTRSSLPTRSRLARCGGCR